MDDQRVGYFRSWGRDYDGLEAVVEMGKKWENLRKNTEVKSEELMMLGWGK